MTSDSEPADPSLARGERLRELLASCIDRATAEGMTAVEELLARHPDLAAEVRERLARLRDVGLLPAASDDERMPERLGEFRLLRRIGSGGMGVVYLALQESLDREVALKLVRPEQTFFPGARERFRREVDAIARLNDPGIVPIHAVGEDAGIPYFAMEYVVGATLADVVAAAPREDRDGASGRDLARLVAGRAGVPLPDPLPETYAGTWVQTCCRIVQRIALAVDHAHERGVLHRDIKPTNVMLTPNGRVLLLDFGLAAAEGTTPLTRSGAMLGTLHSMAPEQLLGRDVDERTDVYALGVTLYELLALAPPFDEGNAQALRAAILAGAPPRLGRRGAAIPRDVATICHCALDRDPARRYPSAAELARDLGRFLALRPVHARPTGLVVRTQRLAQRHPAWATAVGLLLVGAIGGGGVFARMRSVADEQRATAASNLTTALRAIQQLLAHVADRNLANVPGLDRVRNAELETAIAMLQALRRDNERSDELSDELSLKLSIGLIEASELRRLFGQAGAAEEVRRVAQGELERLVARRPGVPEHELALAIARAGQGEHLREAGDLPGAIAAWRRSSEELSALLDPDRGSPLGLHALTNCTANLGTALQATGDLDGAEAAFARTLEVEQRMLKRSADVRTALDAVQTRMQLADLLLRRGKPAEALARLVEAVTECEALHARAPGDPEIRRALARAHTRVGKVVRQQGDLARATSGFSAALAHFAALVALYPDRAAYQRDRNLTELELGVTAAMRGDHPEAIQRLRDAIGHHEALLERAPDVDDTKAELGQLAWRLAEQLMAQDPHAVADAEAWLGRAVDWSRQAAADRAHDAYYTGELGRTLTRVGLHALRVGDPERAAGHLRAAIDAFDESLRRGSEFPNDAECLPYALRLQVTAAAASDDPDTAIAALRRLQALRPLSRAEVADLGMSLHLDEHPGFEAILAAAR